MKLKNRIAHTILHSSLFTLHLRVLSAAALLTALVSSCARMGAPDGGWYDETPPHVVGASPADRGTDVRDRKVSILFNEFIKVDDVAEKVVISPPQMEMPEIKATGKKITVELLDSLQPNTTYTIDFSDAIQDNNENNPMGNYTYSFSTGGVIDTLEVSGTVLTADKLEPVKGMLVGLYKEADDSLFRHAKDSLPPFVRVSRTDSEGRFVVRGIAPGRYTVGALMDIDGNYRFNQKAEKMAFSYDVVVPSVFVDTRQDTVWADELHIKDILRVKYNHFVPDNIVLRAFDHELTDRYFLKTDRTEADHFTLFFTAPLPNDSAVLAKLGDVRGDARLPILKGLNFNSDDAFVVESSMRGDTVTYWLRDTALVNQDTLRMEMQTLVTDTLGVLQHYTDTLEILAKTSYEKRMKKKQRDLEEWQEKLEKRRKQLEEGEELADTLPPPLRLVPKYDFAQSLSPDGTVYLNFPAPMRRVSRDAVHLYVQQDSLWYRAPFVFRPVRSKDAIVADTLPRRWELFSEWIPGAEYSLEVDSLAFEDIYGLTSDPYKSGLKVRRLEEFSSLFVNVTHNLSLDTLGAQDGDSLRIIVQLLDTSDKPVRTAPVVNGTAEFYYLAAGTYYMCALVDRNGNGRWDTGDFYADRQPEEVYYYPGKVECRAKWDVTKAWDITALPLNRQKPDAITKQKAEKKKTIQNRNAQRAADKGIEPPAK